MSETIRQPQTIRQPAWVDALDEAKKALHSAGESKTPEVIDSLTRVAYGWMDISRLLKTEEK